jgi:glycosyltransferase involved in cell wall biosynthesis
VPKPVVTVIIPNHNYSDYILNALDSVSLQDYEFKQVVFIDDASTDNSYEKVTRELDNLSKVPDTSHLGFLIKQGIYHNGLRTVAVKLPKKRGQGFARNTGIGLAWNYTDLFAMLDSDDQWYENRLSVCVSRFEENPRRIGAVYTDYDILHVNNEIKIREFKEPFSRRRLLQDNIVHSGCVVSKFAFQAVGLYDENLPPVEDYDLWLRISEQFMIVHVPESYLLVRVHDKNCTNTIPPEVWQKKLQLTREKLLSRAQKR